MRKDNYAARVMTITPHRGAVTGNEARHTAINEPTSQVDRIDVWRHEAYFSLRIRDVISDGKGATVKAGPKGRGSSPTSPTGGFWRGEAFGIARARVQRSALHRE